MAQIKVEHLKYRYPLTHRLALDDISFSVESGEFVGLVGRNGAGKSTLCQAFTGLVPNFYKGAYGGRVLLSDMDVAQSDLSEVCLKAGIVFQNPFSQVTGAKLTVYEEIAFGLENMGLSRAEMRERIDGALHLLDIYQFREHNPFDLSGGQMQRMAIAGVIAMRPEVLILDEPTSQLDPQGSEEVFRAVRKLSREEGITVVMAEHKMEKVAAYSDRVLLLNEGKLVAFDTPREIFSREDLALYGVTPPVYTQVCRELRAAAPDGRYPVTLEEAARALGGSAGAAVPEGGGRP